MLVGCGVRLSGKDRESGSLIVSRVWWEMVSLGIGECWVRGNPSGSGNVSCWGGGLSRRWVVRSGLGHMMEVGEVGCGSGERKEKVFPESF